MFVWLSGESRYYAKALMPNPAPPFGGVSRLGVPPCAPVSDMNVLDCLPVV